MFIYIQLRKKKTPYSYHMEGRSEHSFPFHPPNKWLNKNLVRIQSWQSFCLRNNKYFVIFFSNCYICTATFPKTNATFKNTTAIYFKENKYPQQNKNFWRHPQKNSTPNSPKIYFADVFQQGETYSKTNNRQKKNQEVVLWFFRTLLNCHSHHQPFSISQKLSRWQIYTTVDYGSLMNKQEKLRKQKQLTSIREG